MAFFRDDFSGEPLNALMNRLASSPDAVLVDAASWQRFNLNTGDTLDLLVTPSSGDPATLKLIVAGAFTRFPTWNPDQAGALFVTNLDYLFETWGGLQPYAVWLRTAPNAATQAILDGINQMGVSVVRAQDAPPKLTRLWIYPDARGCWACSRSGSWPRPG